MRTSLHPDMADLKPRIITGIVLVMFITVCVLFGPYSFFLLIFLVNLLGIHEFYTLFELRRFKKIAGIFLASVFLITTSLVISRLCGWKLMLLTIPAAYGIFISALYTQSENPFTETALIFLALIYITVPCLSLMCLAYVFPVKASYHAFMPLGLFMMLWAGDSGAYLTGKLSGKHALFKRISPNKTWEGAVGGAVSALLAAILISCIFKELNLISWLTMALITIVAGTFGDLVKSLMKRSRGVKDTGTILPGHGGILDRFDSLLGSAPLVYIYLITIYT